MSITFAEVGETETEKCGTVEPRYLVCALHKVVCHLKRIRFHVLKKLAKLEVPLYFLFLNQKVAQSLLKRFNSDAPGRKNSAMRERSGRS